MPRVHEHDGPPKNANGVVTDLSVSRIKTADDCGLKYRYQYIDRVPAPEDSATRMFGSVVHTGTERWYEGDFQNTQLRDYIEADWWERLPKAVIRPLRKAIKAQEDTAALEQLIRIGRPTIKAPSQTKDYQNSAENKIFQDRVDELLVVCNKQPDIRWPKAENALQAYHKSLQIGDQLQARWCFRPKPIAIERKFVIPFAGIMFTGYIDQIRVDPDPHGEVHPELLDIKTSKQVMTQMETFIQAYIYYEACVQLEDLPTPDYVTFWLARLNKPQHGKIDRKRQRKLAERIVGSIRRKLEVKDHEPQYGMWCRNCDFRSLCETEIGMWPAGTDSLVLA